MTRARKSLGRCEPEKLQLLMRAVACDIWQVGHARLTGEPDVMIFVELAVQARFGFGRRSSLGQSLDCVQGVYCSIVRMHGQSFHLGGCPFAGLNRCVPLKKPFERSSLWSQVRRDGGGEDDLDPRSWLGRRGECVLCKTVPCCYCWAFAAEENPSVHCCSRAI